MKVKLIVFQCRELIKRNFLQVLLFFMVNEQDNKTSSQINHRC